jgi:hypothetical protein
MMAGRRRAGHPSTGLQSSPGSRSRRVPAFKVAPGDWIRIPLAGDPFPVHMIFEGQPRRAAFVDHERSPGGQMQTLAAMRCPQMRPGVYELVVELPVGAPMRTAIEVI